MLLNILEGKQARDCLRRGSELLAKTVSSTLGPKGRNIIIYNKNNKPYITKDGVTVAKYLNIKEDEENVAIQVIKQAALKTNTTVGDGTTTSIILANAIFQKACNYIEEGANPIDIKKGILDISKDIIKLIKNRSIKINDISLLNSIATISANNDKEIGELVSQNVYSIGCDGTIVAEESKNINTYVNICSGMKFNRGYLSHYFITDNKKREIVLNTPLVFITDSKINNVKDVINLTNNLYSINEETPCILIASDFSEQVVNTLAYYKVNNLYTIIPIKAPGFGDYRTEMLEDIAIATNATAITSKLKMKTSDLNINVAGKADKIIINKDNTIIFRSKDYDNDVKERIIEIKDLMKNCESDFLLEKYKERLSRLSGGIATIYVGGSTDVEIKEKKDRIDDAICASKAALKEGVVVGGGITYLKIVDCFTIEESSDINKGKLCLIKALKSIFNKIVINAGKNPKEILSEITTSKQCLHLENIGYDANNNIVCDLLKNGIVDSTKVSYEAIINAVSAATTLLLTNYVFIEKEES